MDGAQWATPVTGSTTTAIADARPATGSATAAPADVPSAVSGHSSSRNPQPLAVAQGNGVGYDVPIMKVDSEIKCDSEVVGWEPTKDDVQEEEDFKEQVWHIQHCHAAM